MVRRGRRGRVPLPAAAVEGGARARRAPARAGAARRRPIARRRSSATCAARCTRRSRKVSDDIGRRRTFNTAIAAVMELLNALAKLRRSHAAAARAVRAGGARDRRADAVADRAARQPRAVARARPRRRALVDAAVADGRRGGAGAGRRSSSCVQVNGKLRGRVTVPADADEGTVRAAALADAHVQKFVEGQAGAGNSSSGRRTSSRMSSSDRNGRDRLDRLDPHRSRRGRPMAGLAFTLGFVVTGGCGFHLQGDVKMPTHLHSVYIATSDELTPFATELRDAFEHNGLDDRATLERRRRGRARREGQLRAARAVGLGAQYAGRVRGLLHGRVLRWTAGVETVPNADLELTRNFSFDESLLLAKEHEEEIIRDAMARDLATTRAAQSGLTLKGDTRARYHRLAQRVHRRLGWLVARRSRRDRDGGGTERHRRGCGSLRGPPLVRRQSEVTRQGGGT